MCPAHQQPASEVTRELIQEATELSKSDTSSISPSTSPAEQIRLPSRLSANTFLGNELCRSEDNINGISTLAHEKQTQDHFSATVDHPARQLTIGGVVDAYERAFLESGEPRIEDYLPADQSDRLLILQDILQVDIELRLRKKQSSVTVRTYLERFPELTLRPDIVMRLVEREVRCRQKLGYKLDLYSYEIDHPTLVSGIRRVFHTLGALPVEIPGYSQLEKIGQGGMGVVFRANETGLNRTVALKMIRDRAVGDSGSLQRFEMEAKSLASLEHPNIVRIHNYGVREDGLPFFSLEYCHGGSLAELLSKDPPTPRIAAKVTSVLAKAMGFAHSRSKPIFHRDLKPGNILLAKPCDSMEYLDVATLKIADFGLAKTDDESDGGFTQTGGGPIGTLYYMAPEQAANAKDAKGSADIYALGVILYEMIAGRVPFRGKTQREILKQLEENDPVPLARLVPGCPPDLETICLKCLEKKPSNRYLTADALAADIDAFLENRPISARPVGSFEKATKWVSRNRLVSALAAVTMVSLVSGMVLSLLFAYRASIKANDALIAKKQAEESGKEAVRQQKEAEKQSMEANRANDNLRQAVENTDRERALGLVGQLLNASPEALGQVLLSIDQFHASVDPILRERFAEARGRNKERMALVLLARDDSMIDCVSKGLRTAPAKEIPFYSERLSRWRNEFIPEFWSEIFGDISPRAERLRAAACLSAWDTTSTKWDEGGGARLARLLVELEAIELGTWIPMVFPVRQNLYQELLRLMDQGARVGATASDVNTGSMAAQLLNGIVDDARVLAQAASLASQGEFDLLSGALVKNRERVCVELERFLESVPPISQGMTGRLLRSLSPELVSRMKLPATRSATRTEWAAKTAKILAALAALGRSEKLWDYLAQSDTQDLLAELLVAVPARKVPLSVLFSRYEKDKNPQVKSSILKIIGYYPQNTDESVKPHRKSFESLLAKDYETQPDPGLHSAICWLMSCQWKNREAIRKIDSKMSGIKVGTTERMPWRVNGQGQTLVLVAPGNSYEMGAIPEDSERLLQKGKDLELIHRVTIPYGFEISQKEITLGEFRKYKPSFQAILKVNPDQNPDVSVSGVSWFDAVGYCQWLTEQEQISPNEYCFPRQGNSISGIVIPASFCQKEGYRLPTEEEWELVARAGNLMPYPCGMASDHLDHFAVTWRNGGEKLMPSGSKIPNAFGLFDTSGNVLEWTMDAFDIYDPFKTQELNKLKNQAAYLNVSGSVQMVIRGGSFNNSPTSARHSARLALSANMNNVSMGFRVCRTVMKPVINNSGKIGNTSR